MHRDINDFHVFTFPFVLNCSHPCVLGSRSIAKVVSQVHAFQEAVCPYSPDRELQAYLRRRIARLATSDIHLLASDSDANFQQSSERQTRRIQDKLRRVKATFKWALPQSQLAAHSETPAPGQHLVCEPRLRVHASATTYRCLCCSGSRALWTGKPFFTAIMFSCCFSITIISV